MPGKTLPARWALCCLIPVLVCGVAVAVSVRSAAAAQAESATTPPPAPPADSLAAQGKLIFDKTPKLASQYVGNKLACGDCHIASGTMDYASSMKDVAGLFPSFSQRAGHVITLTDRINECFVRSENGKPLPANSPEMLAIVAYIQFLSEGQKPGQPYARRGLVKLPDLKGDATRGKLVYTQTGCAMCHGANGGGMPPVMPPLWGPDSFNDGAGLAHTAKMAAWVYHNMPQTNPGSLTQQQAFDVSAYIDSMPHPKFNPVFKSF
jgi:thiosulfate dehydrogenase